MTFFDHGSHEGLKGGTHIALGTLAAVCFAYNGLAWLLRGESHLARNIVVYGVLLAYEAETVRRHRAAR